MPLKSRGSVSARFNVWFSSVNRAANVPRSAAGTSSPPGSMAASAASPWTRCSDARRFVPASVNASIPDGNASLARVIRFGGAPPASNHRSRPAIMRWNTRNRSPSRTRMMRLPMRRTSRTRLPSASAIGGTAVRSTNGLSIRISVSGAPTTRAVSASRYSAISGSSGIAVDLSALDADSSLPSVAHDIGRPAPANAERGAGHCRGMGAAVVVSVSRIHGVQYRTGPRLE